MEVKEITKDEALDTLAYFASRGELTTHEVTSLIAMQAESLIRKKEEVRQQLIDTEVSLVKILSAKPRQQQEAIEFVAEKMGKYRGKTYMGVDEIAKEMLNRSSDRKVEK